tara:strand:- start:129 stop:512 length:384 start_codon:yes stop_codon:yes gene_type:complete
VSNKINDSLDLLGKKFKEVKTNKEFFKKNLKNNKYIIGAKNLKILYCLYILEKKKISIEEIKLFLTIDRVSIPKFPFDGKFLLKKGFQEGKNIGIVLKEAEKIWIQNNFNLSSDELEIIIKKKITSN